MLIRNRLSGRYITTFNLNFTGYNYLVNQQKDYFLITTGVRQSFGKLATKFEYLLLPNYLIRYYQDPSGSQYIGCEYTEQLLSLKISLNLRANTETGILLGYEIDDHIENFDIYDAKALRFSPYIDFATLKRIESRLTYEFKSSSAKGPIPDVSYAQHRIVLTNYLSIGFPRLSKLIFSYQLKYRIYTTEVSPIIDTPHSGREDLTQIFEFNFKLPLFSALYFNSGYSYEFRRSHSEVYPDIGIYKDYNKWMINGGFEFEY